MDWDVDVHHERCCDELLLTSVRQLFHSLPLMNLEWELALSQRLKSNLTKDFLATKASVLERAGHDGSLPLGPQEPLPIVVP